MFTTPPGCLFHHQASFITDFFKNEAGAKAGDYDFFPFPDINPPYAGARHRRRRPVRHVQRHAAGPVADQVPADARGAGDLGRSAAAFISANKNVRSTPTRTTLARGRPQILPRRKTFRFDASDLMPERDERRVLQGDRRLRPGPERARLASCPTSTRSRPTPTAADAGRTVARRRPVGPVRPPDSGEGVELDALLEPHRRGAIVVVVAVPIVLVGYILLVEAIARLAPRGPPAGVPAVAVAGAGAGVPRRVPRLPDDRDDRPELPRTGAVTTFVGLDNYQLVLQPAGHPHRAAEQRPLGRPAAALVVGARACWSRSSSTASATRASVKTVIFLPLAISFVAAGVIWRFMYDAATRRSGTLNAARHRARAAIRIAWLLEHAAGTTFLLIVVGVWMLDRLRDGDPVGRPQGHQRRAARGGPGRRRQRAARCSARIILPLLLPTIAVVATTMVISALKAFDIVYVMTSGNFDTDVIANSMYKQLFNDGQPGARRRSP